MSLPVAVNAFIAIGARIQGPLFIFELKCSLKDLFLDLDECIEFFSGSL